VVTRCRSCLRIAFSAGVYDIAGVTVLGLPARVKDLLPDRRSALVGWLSHRATRVDGCLLALSAVVVLHAALMTYAGRRAFVLLHDHLLDEGLRLVVQVACLRCRGRGHGSEQRRCCNELWTCARQCVQVVDIEVSVDALASLLA
jgi:hypothetical protein